MISVAFSCATVAFFFKLAQIVSALQPFAILQGNVQHMNELLAHPFSHYVFFVADDADSLCACETLRRTDLIQVIGNYVCEPSGQDLILI